MPSLYALTVRADQVLFSSNTLPVVAAVGECAMPIDVPARQPRQRSRAGNMLLGSLFVVICVCIPITLFVCRSAERIILEQKSQWATQSACLVAARDLSRIVVADPYWGYISLGDYPAVGRQTLAADHEALPVLGINTIMATARLEMLLADELEDDKLRQLALEDSLAARQAASRLNETLQEALRPKSTVVFTDADGKRVRPYAAAWQELKKQLADSSPLHLHKISLQLGWLNDVATTMTPVPQPENLADLKAGDCIAGNYTAFRNIRTGGLNYTFAGLSRQPSLCLSRSFRDADAQHACSAIRLTAEVTPTASEQKADIKTAACAIPGSMAEMGRPGTLVLNLPHGYVDGINSWQELIANRQLNAARTDNLQACGGDFPTQRGARLQLAGGNDGIAGTSTVAQIVTRGLRDWLRTARGKVRLDSLLEMLTARFPQRPGQGASSAAIVYQVKDDGTGTIITRVLKEGLFLKKTVSDRQLYASTNNALRTSRGTWLVTIHNHVSVIGAQSGQHGGQPIADELPVEFANYSGHLELAELDVRECRRSFRQGGLAVALEISSPQM